MIKIDLKKILVNFFGALGYLSITLQWILVFIVNFSFIESLALLMGSSTDKQYQVVEPSAAVNSEPNLTLIIFGVIVTVAMVLLSVYLFVKMPSMIAKAGKKAVHGVAQHTVPLILKAQHKKDTKKNSRFLTPHLVAVIKAVLIITPAVLIYMSQSLGDKILSFDIAMYASLWLAGVSLVLFVFQYVLAKILVIKIDNL